MSLKDRFCGESRHSCESKRIPCRGADGDVVNNACRTDARFAIAYLRYVGETVVQRGALETITNDSRVIGQRDAAFEMERFASQTGSSLGTAPKSQAKPAEPQRLR